MEKVIVFLGIFTIVLSLIIIAMVKQEKILQSLEGSNLGKVCTGIYGIFIIIYSGVVLFFKKFLK